MCPSVPNGKGLDWVFMSSRCALGVDRIGGKVRILLPDSLLRRLDARTGDEVHRLQNGRSRVQAREAEPVAPQGRLC
jgi:hypothetical protein